MKFLISLNQLKQLPNINFLMKMINQTQTLSIDGFEVNVDVLDPVELDYLKALLPFMKSQQLQLQIHTPHQFDQLISDDQALLQTLEAYHTIGRLLNQEIIVVIHSIPHENPLKAIEVTKQMIQRLNAIIKANQLDTIRLSLENLNNNRLNTPSIETIVQQNDIHFCWDIAHEVSDDLCDYTLKPSLIKQLNNIHIHDVNDEGKDHYPFIFNTVDYKKAIDYLTAIGYDDSIVLEINPKHFETTDFFKIIENYLNNLAMIKAYYQKRKILAVEYSTPSS